MLTIGSLFSGIGGLELGLEWAGLGPTLWQVEADPLRRMWLERRWPATARHDDVRRIGSVVLEPVGLICGGFPCQDNSRANTKGDRAGLDGPRSGLWREFARVVSELRPGYVVVENVASGAALWVDAVVHDLEELGYACLSVPLSSRDVGAPFERRRVFVVGRRTDGYREPVEPFNAEVAKLSRARAALSDEDRACLSRADGLSARMVGYGNAVDPFVSEVVGWLIRELEGL